MLMTNVQNQGNDDYQDFQIALQDSLGIVIGDDYRGRIEGRLQPLMMRQRLSKLSDLASALRDDSHSAIRSEVLEAISTQDMAWFRYPELNQLVCGYIIPSLQERGQSECRLWYPGCGLGQGAYSLAMSVAETLSQGNGNFSVKIIATDSSESAIQSASTGSYSESGIEGLSEHYRQRYVHQVDGEFSIDDAVCELIEFKACDLVTEAASKQHFDVIFSPDVLMYFSTSYRSQILGDFARLLDPSGIMLLNNGEMVLPYCDRFEMVEHSIATFYRQVS